MEFTATYYYQEAQKMLEKKDFADFMSNIGSAIAIAKTNLREDNDTYTQTLVLKVKGLLAFNQYNKVVEVVDQILQENKDINTFDLEKYKGVACAYLNEPKRAVKIFEKLIPETNDTETLNVLYLYLAWALLLIERKSTNQLTLDLVKKYLDIADSNFDLLTKRQKMSLLKNYSVYYFYKKDYDTAIQKLEEALPYCEENDLASIYVNFAELYFPADEFGTSTKALQYLHDAEVLSEKNKDELTVGKVYLTKAMFEIREDQLFTALDSLYLALTLFTRLEAYIYAFNCLLQINNLEGRCKESSLARKQELFANLTVAGCAINNNED